MALEHLARYIYDCTRCGFCRVWGWKGVEYVCPTYPHTTAWDTEYARGRVRLARAVLENELEVTPDMLEHIYECTLCGSCAVHCPIELPLVDIFHALREEIAARGHRLDSHQQIALFIERFDNPYGPKPDEEVVPEYARKSQAEILFYPGCTNTRMAPEEVQAVAELFQGLGLDFAIFDDDTCCGIPLYEIGQMEGFRRVAGKTLELIRKRNPKVIVASCPACYRALKVLYQEEEELRHDFEVQHLSEFLLPLVPGRLKPLVEKVTWHDPCVLGRHQGIYEEPREVLRQVPGLELVEMESHHADSLCCGAGGGVFFTRQDVAAKTVESRLEQALATGARYLVTSCPNCYVRFRQSIRKGRRPIRPASLATLINEVLKHGTDTGDASGD
jgi:heterodisulfide reductase subunit D